MSISEWSELTEEEAQEWTSSRPPNSCNCPDCMHSWEKKKEFDKIENKKEYYTQRTRNYEVDDLIFDVTKDITDGDKLFWTENEHKLRELYSKMFGAFSGYSVMLGFKEMGKEVEYVPEVLREDRATNYEIDAKLIILNAMSDNPRFELMTDGEIKIYEKLRKTDYYTPDERRKRKEDCDKLTAFILGRE